MQTRRFCALPENKKALSLHAHALNVAPLYVLIDRSIALIESVGDWIIGDWIVATLIIYVCDHDYLISALSPHAAHPLNVYLN